MDPKTQKNPQDGQDQGNVTPAKAKIEEPSQRDLMAQELDQKRAALVQLKARAADFAFDREQAQVQLDAATEGWKAVIDQVKGLAADIQATEAAMKRLP